MQSRSKRSSKGITAWLVTWEWAGDHAAVERRIAAILNAHWSGARVREHVELIYVNSSYSILERISYAKNRSFNPYPAEFVKVHGIPWEAQIICGHNPWLFGRMVDNLRAGTEDDEDTLVWTERPKPDFGPIVHKLGLNRQSQT